MKLQAVDLAGHSQPLEIDLSKKIGEGATATVYRVIFGNELLAAKIYKPERTFSSHKLEAMLQSPPAEVVTNDDGQTFIQYTWVKYLLKDGSENLVGFLMHFVDQRSTNSLDTYYDPVLIKRLPSKMHTALSLRIEIARNLCDLIDRLHDVGHYFIDIKPQNIRVYRDNNKVVLMDCDGYSIKNNQSSPDRFPADLISTDFIAPEVLKNHLSPNSLGEEQDRYGLAVLLFQLLNRGTHPFQGVVTDPSIQVTTNDERAALGLYPHGRTPHPAVKPRQQSIHELLPDYTCTLFDQAFTALDRPSAKQWKNHFQSILDNKQLVRCKEHPSEISHIHFAGKGCIGCKIEELEKNKVSLPPRSYKAASDSPTYDSSSSTGANIGSSQSQPTYSTSSSPKSKNTDLTIFAAVMVVIGLFVFALTFNSPSNSSATNSTAVSNAPSYSAKCDSFIRQTSNEALCQAYWGYTANTCEKDIEIHLRYQGKVYSPHDLCGTTNPRTDSYVDRVNGYKKEIVAGAIRVIDARVDTASTAPGYVNPQNKLPGQRLLDRSAAQKIELYQTWWLTNEFFFMHIENVGAESISSIKISVFNSCSASRKIINSFLLTPSESIPGWNRVVIRAPLPLPSIPDSDAFRCVDVEMAFSREAAPSNNKNATTTTAPSPTSGFVSVYISNNRGAGWTAAGKSKRDAEAAAKESCAKFSNDGETCSKWFTERGRCVGVARDSKGVFGGAWGDNEALVGKWAIDHCKESGGSDCTLSGTLCE